MTNVIIIVNIVIIFLIITLFTIPIIIIFYMAKKIKHHKNVNSEIPTIEAPNNQENYNYQYQDINQEQKQEKICPYERKLLLTKNEWNFYKKLKKITDKYNLYILSKVRMEDVIRVKDGFSYSETQSARGRIKSRHIDFIIAEPEYLQVLIAIELDDNSHRYRKAKEADNFKNEVFTEVGLPYIRTYGYDDIEEKICKILNIERSPHA